jgi:hypothetical protein
MVNIEMNLRKIGRGGMDWIDLAQQRDRWRALVNTVWGVPTINVLLQMVCTFIGTLCKYTTCVMRCLRRSSWCYWSAVDCDSRATCNWSRLTALLLERLLGVLSLHWGWLDGACCSVKPDEARELIWLFPT